MSEGFMFSTEAPTDAQTPLVRFRGVLKEVVSETLDANEFRTKPSLRASFNFIDLEVLESNEPYPFPIATIKIGYTERSDTRWAVFTKSLRDIMPDPVDRLIMITGKSQEWYYGPCMLRGPVSDAAGNPIMERSRPKWANQPSNAWQVVSVEGFSSAKNNGNLKEDLINLLNGKSESDFYQTVFTESSLKAYGQEYLDTVTDITSRKWLPAIEAAKLATKDTEGVWHKV